MLESTANFQKESSHLCKECFRKVESLIKRTKDFEGGKREITEVRNLCKPAEAVTTVGSEISSAQSEQSMRIAY